MADHPKTVHFKIIGSDEKGWDAVQITANGPWWHSVQRGLWPTKEAAIDFVEKGWGDRYTIRYLAADESIYERI